MTHERDRLAGSDKGLNQPDRILILGEIPHGAVAARVEHGVEIRSLDGIEAKRIGELRIRGGVGLEPSGQVSAKFRVVALRVERRLTAFRRSQNDLRAGVLKVEK